MSTDHIKQIDRAIHALPHDHPAPLQYLTIAVSLSEIQRTSTTAATEATESNGADDDVDAQGCLSDTAFLELCIKRIEDILRQRQTDAYILIILASTGQAEAGQSRLIAGGTAERQMPGLGWWFWNIGRIPHALRKGMKRMYIVHPSSYTKTLLPLFLPIISPKAITKIYPVPSLLSLVRTYHVSLSGLRPALPSLLQEASIVSNAPAARPYGSTTATAPRHRRQKTWSDTVSGLVGTVAAYVPLSQLVYAPLSPIDGDEGSEKGYCGRTAEDLAAINNGVGDAAAERRGPRPMDELRRVIVEKCSGTEGIFRIAPNASLRPALIALLKLPIDQQPWLAWDEIATYDPTLPPKMYLWLFKSLAEPLISHDLYPLIRQSRDLTSLSSSLSALSPPARSLLHHLLTTLYALLPYTSTTRMTPLALAIVVAPDLIRSPDPLEDLAMCLPPPATPDGSTSGQGGGGAAQAGRAMAVPGMPERKGESLVGVLKMILERWNEVEPMFAVRR